MSVLHVNPSPIALNATEGGDGVIVHLESADIESHDPARVQTLHQVQVVHNASEVSWTQLSPEAEGDNILISSPLHASFAAEILSQGFLISILKAIYGKDL